VYDSKPKRKVRRRQEEPQKITNLDAVGSILPQNYMDEEARANFAREHNLANSVSSLLDEKTLEQEEVIKILDVNSQSNVILDRHDSMLTPFKDYISSGDKSLDDPQPLLKFFEEKETSQSVFKMDHLARELFASFDQILRLTVRLADSYQPELYKLGMRELCYCMNMIDENLLYTFLHNSLEFYKNFEAFVKLLTKPKKTLSNKPRQLEGKNIDLQIAKEA